MIREMTELVGSGRTKMTALPFEWVEGEFKAAWKKGEVPLRMKDL